LATQVAVFLLIW